MTDEPLEDCYCGEHEGRPCSYSPTKYCRATINECAKAKHCVMPEKEQTE